MKKIVLLATLAVALASMASASQLCTGVGTTTLADLIAMNTTGSTCQIGDKLFSNFGLISTALTTAFAVPASAIIVTPDSTDPYNPGLIFSSAGWNTTNSAQVDSKISFTVTVIPGGHLIDDAGLTLISGSESGLGSGGITETLKGMGLQMQVDTFATPSSHVSFAPTTSLSVVKDLLVTTGPSASGGFAQITQFEESFSEIPEPVGTILIGSGLLALGVWRRRVRRG